MKLTKLMLSAFTAAMVLVSCNKQEPASQNGNVRLKSVEVSLENITFAKSVVEDVVKGGEKIIVSDFQIFLLDGEDNEYTGMISDGSEQADSYWSGEVPATASFHYVDPKCTKVVAVANMGKEYGSYAELVADTENTTLEIGEAQDPTNMALYAMDDTFEASGYHNDQVGNSVIQQEAYKVDLVLKPRISRFEVDGFSVEFEDPANPKYNEIKITQLSFIGYYPNTDLFTGTESGALENPIANFEDQSAVYPWLDGLTGTTPWNRDLISSLTITPAAPVQDLPADGKLAYHMFSCNAVPVFVIKLEVDGQPAYLYTKNLKDGNGSNITEFQEGYIYRMSAAGETAADGTLVIPEEAIDPMDRCLDITVEIMSWKVVLVTPEF